MRSRLLYQCMKVVLFGATGMVGQGVLRECLLDPGVESVLAIGRRASGEKHQKLRQLVTDLSDFSTVAAELTGHDACFFCLGVSSAGMSEQAYRRVTYDIAMAAAQALVERNPAMTFIFVSGAGADGTGRGRIMWARVKGQTENALGQLPFKATYVFRPAFIQPLHGIRSRTRWLGVFYSAIGPLYPLLKALLPRYVTTTEQVGRAMIAAAAYGAPKPVLENDDINALGAQYSTKASSG
jgi:uncharacterized protein YbjT (DUF2867 family)